MWSFEFPPCAEPEHEPLSPVGVDKGLANPPDPLRRDQRRGEGPRPREYQTAAACPVPGEAGLPFPIQEAESSGEGMAERVRKCPDG